MSSYLPNLKSNLKLDLNAKDNILGNTPLYLAAWNGRTEIAKYLIDKNATLDIQNQWDCTALHIATEHGKTEIAKYLIDKGAKLDIQDQWGQTPLHYAVQGCKKKIIKSLIDAFKERNPDNNKAIDKFIKTKNKNGKTALDLTADSCVVIY